MRGEAVGKRGQCPHGGPQPMPLAHGKGDTARTPSNCETGVSATPPQVQEGRMDLGGVDGMGLQV